MWVSGILSTHRLQRQWHIWAILLVQTLFLITGCPKYFYNQRDHKVPIVTINFYIVVPTSNQPQNLEECFNSFTSISALLPILYQPGPGSSSLFCDHSRKHLIGPQFSCSSPLIPSKAMHCSFSLSPIQCT